MNTALNRTTVALLTNKSGGSVAQGDVVIVDSANAAAFTTTTTTAYVSGSVGVVLEPNGIASNAIGTVAFSGYVPIVNLSGSASLGDVFKTHSVAKQAVRHAGPIVTGDFGQVLGTGTTPAALLWAEPSGSGGGGTTPALAKAVRTTGDITVTSTTFADLDGTNLSLTITTGAHHVKVGWLVVAHNSLANDNICIDVTVDGTRQGQTFGLTLSSNAASDNCNLSGVYLTDALSAASHTFKLQARVDAGTGTFFSSTGVSPIVFWVEECAS